MAILHYESKLEQVLDEFLAGFTGKTKRDEMRLGRKWNSLYPSAGLNTFTAVALEKARALPTEEGRTLRRVLNKSGVAEETIAALLRHSGTTLVSGMRNSVHHICSRKSKNRLPLAGTHQSRRLNLSGQRRARWPGKNLRWVLTWMIQGRRARFHP